MAKAILICGRIASGKTTYAKKLCERHSAVSLSCDELMLSLFDVHLGDRFQEVSGRAKRYLYSKALELLDAGVDVVLDWGFWTQTERKYARGIFEGRGYACEIHYLDTPNDLRQRYISRRNAEIAEGACQAYPVDDELERKLSLTFRAPQREEVDVWLDPSKERE